MMKIGDLLVLVLFGIILVLLLPVLLPVLAFVFVKDKVKEILFKRFLKANEGHRYFAYTDRKTSQKYVEERVIPNLPAGTHLIFVSGKHGQIHLRDEVKFQDHIIGAMRKVDGGFPYMAKVASGELVAESINDRLSRAIKRSTDAESTLERIERFFGTVGSS